MVLTELQARNFRLFGSLRLRAHPRFNLIVGANGSGKTSLLESVYVLGRASSYRAASATLVKDGEQTWQVEGLLRAAEGDAPAEHLNVLWRRTWTAIERQGAALTAAELVRILPMQILDPGLHSLLEEGPAIRRRFLDWGVFHVEHSYLGVWRRMQRALKQRNAALRSGGSTAEISAWDRDLIQSVEVLTTLRLHYVARLQESLSALLAALLPEERWTLSYRQGWNAGQSFTEAIQQGLERDRRYGQTLSGPHRAELLFLQGKDEGERTVKGRISRGQQKLLVAAFVLCQCDLAREACGKAPVLLIDDFAAELSVEFQHRLFAALEGYPGQKFLAALEISGPLQSLTDASMFHVEHGCLHPLVK